MLDFFTDFLGGLADPLYYIAYWAAGLIGVLASNKMMKAEDYKSKNIFKRPTLLGWSFMVCIVLAFLLSFVRDNKASRDARDFQVQLMRSEQERKASDLKYTNKLEDIDRGLIRRDTVIMQQLNSWGLTLRDSIVVKNSGNNDDPFISSPVNISPVKFEQIGDTAHICGIISNTGNYGAILNAKVYYMISANGIYMASKKPYSIVSNYSIPAHSDVVLPDNPIQNLNLNFMRGDIFILIQGDYKRPSSNKKPMPVHIVYSFRQKERKWGIEPDISRIEYEFIHSKIIKNKGM